MFSLFVLLSSVDYSVFVEYHMSYRVVAYTTSFYCVVAYTTYFHRVVDYTQLTHIFGIFFLSGKLVN